MNDVFLLLFDVVSEIESNNNSNAIRYEDRFYCRLTHISVDSDKALSRISRWLGWTTFGTLRRYASFSVSRVQILVYNMYFIDGIYEYLDRFGLLPVPIPTGFAKIHEQEIFLRFLEERIPFYHRVLEDPLYLARFAKLYNGSPKYAKDLHKLISQRLGKKPYPLTALNTAIVNEFRA